MTSGREPVNPRPTAYKHIHNLYHGDTIGSTPHTTGINADINTFVWLDQEWDPDTDARDTLREYARVLLAAVLADDFAEGVLGLEQNWEGPLAKNVGVEETLDRWKKLEGSASSDVAERWRLQCPLLRAHYDAFIQRRLMRETGATALVMEELSSDRSRQSIHRALTRFEERTTDAIEADLHERCTTLSRSLNASIGLKSSVEGQGAAQKGRGAFMDAIEEPLNDAKWLTDRLEMALIGESESERSSLVGSILERTDPGEGGIYDNLGTPDQIGQLVNSVEIGKDPGGLTGSRRAFGIALEGMTRSQTVEIKLYKDQPIPMTWLTRVEAIYDTPLILAYDGLDDSRTYRLCVVYPSRIGKKARLTANGVLIHELIATGDEPFKTFSIPEGVVRNGRIEFEWTGGGERGVQVAELWLRRAQ